MDGERRGLPAVRREGDRATTRVEGSRPLAAPCPRLKLAVDCPGHTPRTLPAGWRTK